MTQPLVDPQLAAFWASDPSVLRPPVVEEQDHDHRMRLALELAAASLIALKIIRDRLRARHETVDTAGAAAREEWDVYKPLWLKAVAPMLADALRARNHRVAAGAVSALAGNYADALGSYLSDTSADAVTLGLAQQVAAGQNDRVAWQRTAAAYGLDARAMRSYVATAMTSAAPNLLITPAAQAMIDRATLMRVDLLGTSESWTALEVGKVMIWRYQQQAGQLPADALREWDTAEDESTCPTCAPMDHVRVPLAETFDVHGQKLWAPQAHPGCRCRVKLILPTVSKAYDPQEARDPRGRWARTKTAERDATVDALMEEARTLTPANPMDLVANPMDLAGPTGMAAAGSAMDRAGAGMGAARSPFDTVRGASIADVQRRSTSLTALDRMRANLYGSLTDSDERHYAIIPPARRRPRPGTDFLLVTPDRRPSYYLAGWKYNLETLKARDYMVRTLEELNFSRLQADTNFGVNVSDTDPWAALYGAVTYHRRGLDPHGTRGLVADAWDEVMPKARRVWNQVKDHPHRYLGKLDDNELRDVAVMSGWTDGVSIDGEDIREGILAALPHVGEHTSLDTSLGEAFLDYMTWQQPGMVDEAGADLDATLDQYRTVGIELTDHPMEQVLRFDSGQARETDIKRNMITPTGEYGVEYKQYKSAMARFDGDPPPMFIGIQIADVVAVDPADRARGHIS